MAEKCKCPWMGPNFCLAPRCICLALLDTPAPGHTDLMVSPETIDDFMAANPLPEDTPAPDPVAQAARVPEVVALVNALQDMLQAVCGESGFANCVRLDTRTAYPWPALDRAEEYARAALRALAGEGKA
jgi:hypothetical protein